jgi:hypothetical protein
MIDSPNLLPAAGIDEFAKTEKKMSPVDEKSEI